MSWLSQLFYLRAGRPQANSCLALGNYSNPLTSATEDMTYSTYTYARRPELRQQIALLSEEAWPRFLLHGNLYHWHLLFDMFPDCQILLCDSADTLIAVGHTVPIIWTGDLPDLPRTMEEIVLRAKQAHEQRQTPNTLSALAAIVSSAHRRKNLSSRVIQEMKMLARQKSCTTLIAPVRPTWKSRYPLSPMDRYVEWRRGDGAPLDPWIRVHWRFGAQPLCIAPSTLTVEGTIQEWESWTDMVFPESGSYVVPGGLQPMQIDFENDTGRYEDPNFWMQHPVRSE